MTVDHFRDAPEWADTLLFSEEKKEHIYAFSKLDARFWDGKDNILKLYSWPGFYHPRHGKGMFKIIARKDRDFGVIPPSLDKEFYDSICAAKATSLITSIVIGGEWTGYGTIPPSINPSQEETK